MTPVERLQAAIENLERLKDTATPGDWRAGSDTRGNAEVRSWFDNDQNGNTRIAHTYAHDRADSYLIVTLHRTIDAQLEVFKTAIWHIERNYGDTYIPAVARAVQLAEAILGGDS